MKNSRNPSPANASSTPGHSPVSAKTAVVCIGGLSALDRVALDFALEDLRSYWERSFGRGTIEVAQSADLPRPHLRILIGNAANLPEIGELEEAGQLPPVHLEAETYALDAFVGRQGEMIVLRAQDSLGLQYAVYALAEHYLGMQFVHPLWDLATSTPPCPKELHLAVTPTRKMRVFYEASHLHGGIRGTTRRASHFSDVGSWRWEDYEGYPERTKLLVAWVVKNYANIVLFDGTHIQDPGESCLPTQAVWNYIEARGLKTFLNVHPSNLNRGRAFAGISEDDFCGETTQIAKDYCRQLCLKKPGYGKALQSNLELAQKHKGHLAAVYSLWDEGPSAIGAEGKPQVLAKSGCPTCSEIPNVLKWANELDHLNDPEVASRHGLGPIGLGHMGWHWARPDDDLAAREVVPHLPPGSLSVLYYYTNDLRVRTMEGWLRRVEAANATDGGERKILALRELLFGCHTDFPLVHPSSLDALDRDFADFARYRCLAAYAGGVYVMHSTGWLLVWYSLHKQSDPSLSWQSWLTQTLTPLVSGPCAAGIARLLELVRDVELYHGRWEGEPYRYYSWYGIDPHPLAPETLPMPEGTTEWDRMGNFAPSLGGRVVRLVAAGLKDVQGLYTLKNLQPALDRMTAVLAHIGEGQELLAKVAAALAGAANGAFWTEHLVEPIRWTLAFLRARAALFLSYGCYVDARQRVQEGRDARECLARGKRLCRESLQDQEVYTRLRPGFAGDYPQELNPDTLRCLIAAWEALEQDPQGCLGNDLCAFLDQAEERAAAGRI